MKSSLSFFNWSREMIPEDIFAQISKGLDDDGWRCLDYQQEIDLHQHYRTGGKSTLYISQVKYDFYLIFVLWNGQEDYKTVIGFSKLGFQKFELPKWEIQEHQTALEGYFRLLSISPESVVQELVTSCTGQFVTHSPTRAQEEYLCEIYDAYKKSLGKDVVVDVVTPSDFKSRGAWSTFATLLGKDLNSSWKIDPAHCPYLSHHGIKMKHIKDSASNQTNSTIKGYDQKKVKWLARHFIESEQKFVENCKILQEFIYVPMLEQCSEWGVKPVVAKQYTLPIKDLIAANGAFLDAIVTLESMEDIAKVFIEYSEKILGPLSKYIVEKQMRDLAVDVKSNKTLLKFVCQCEKVAFDQLQRIISFTDLEGGPGARPGRYRLLFQDALYATDENSTLAAALTEAIGKAEYNAAQIEDMLASVENRQILLELGKKFGVSTIVKSTSLYQRGMAANEILLDGTILPSSLLLFNNELVVVNHTIKGSSPSHWSFNGMIVAEMGPDKFTIKIHNPDMTPKKTMFFECLKDTETQEEKLVFLNLLQQRLFEAELRGLGNTMMPKSSIFMKVEHERHHYFRLANLHKLSEFNTQGECSLIVFEAKDDISEIMKSLQKHYKVIIVVMITPDHNFKIAFHSLDGTGMKATLPPAVALSTFRVDFWKLFYTFSLKKMLTGKPVKRNDPLCLIAYIEQLQTVFCNRNADAATVKRVASVSSKKVGILNRGLTILRRRAGTESSFQSVLTAEDPKNIPRPPDRVGVKRIVGLGRALTRKETVLKLDQQAERKVIKLLFEMVIYKVRYEAVKTTPPSEVKISKVVEGLKKGKVENHSVQELLAGFQSFARQRSNLFFSNETKRKCFHSFEDDLRSSVVVPVVRDEIKKLEPDTSKALLEWLEVLHDLNNACHHESVPFQKPYDLVAPFFIIPAEAPLRLYEMIPTIINIMLVNKEAVFDLTPQMLGGTSQLSIQEEGPINYMTRISRLAFQSQSFESLPAPRVSAETNQISTEQILDFEKPSPKPLDVSHIVPSALAPLTGCDNHSDGHSRNLSGQHASEIPNKDQLVQNQSETEPSSKDLATVAENLLENEDSKENIAMAKDTAVDLVDESEDSAKDIQKYALPAIDVSNPNVLFHSENKEALCESQMNMQKSHLEITNTKGLKETLRENLKEVENTVEDLRKEIAQLQVELGSEATPKPHLASEETLQCFDPSESEAVMQSNSSNASLPLQTELEFANLISTVQKELAFTTELKKLAETSEITKEFVSELSKGLTALDLGKQMDEELAHLCEKSIQKSKELVLLKKTKHSLSSELQKSESGLLSQ